MRSSIRVCRPRLAGIVAALALVVASVQFAAAPASAGPSRPAAPTVSLLKLSPSTVGRSGGSVHLHATVAHAATCTVSSSPHLSGLPATHSCASGHLAETLHVGSNPSTSLRQFTIKLRVTKAGHHVTKSVHLTQDGLLPTVHALAASPTTLPAAGGSTHVTATVAHATKCRLSATPAVAGLPVTTSCSATYSRHVTLPANTSATARQYAFTLVVRGAGGSVTDSTHPHVTVKGAIHPITTTTAKAAPLPSNANTGTSEDATLVAVSCPAAAHCVAVGYYYGTVGSDSSAQLGLIDTFNGTSWTAREAPTPSDISTTEPAVIISSVSCSSATSCVAVGDYLDNVPGLEPYVAVLSGTTWSAEAASVPTDPSYPTLRLGGNLRDVSCASNGCVAVGEYSDPTAGQEALIESPDGSSWVGAAAPLPGGADSTNQYNYLNAVSCTSATACSAVGGYVSGGDEAGLGEVFAQGSWSAAQLAPTADLGEDNVVSCAGTSCTGSGDYNTNVAVIQSQVAGAWTPAGEIPAPLPAVNTGSAKLNGVDCATASSCVLAGSYYTSGSDSAGLIDIGSGTSFAATEAPLPSNATTNNFVTTLSAVSCGSANACVAAGAYEDTNSHIQALIDTESDGGGTPSWTSTEAPLPSGGTSPTLKAISCANSYGCVAVGTYLPSTDTAGGVIVMTAP